MQEAYDHTRECHHHMQPWQDFLEQLAKLEQDIHGKTITSLAGL